MRCCDALRYVLNRVFQDSRAQGSTWQNDSVRCKMKSPSSMRLSVFHLRQLYMYWLQILWFIRWGEVVTKHQANDEGKIFFLISVTSFSFKQKEMEKERKMTIGYPVDKSLARSRDEMF